MAYSTVLDVDQDSFDHESRTSRTPVSPQWSQDSTVSPSETTPLLGILKEETQPTPLPKLQVAALLLVLLPESLTSTLIYPFIVQLVKDLNVVQDDKAIGYYSGLIESCFFLTEAICVFAWARLSDSVGRKPIIMFGSLGLTIAVVCFGFSKTLLTVMASRALQGALNGNTGVVRAMLTEVTDSSNRAQVFAFCPILWATGATFGPLIGGLFAEPVGRLPGFSNAFWKKYPFLLPCIAAGAVSLFAFLSTASIVKETHPAKPGQMPSCFRGNNGAGSSKRAKTTTTASPENRRLSLCLNRRILSIVINQIFLAFVDQAYVALLAIFLATPIASGGLGMDISQIGLLIGGMGLFHGMLQPFCFGPLYRRFDPRTLYTTCMLLMVPMYACLPVMGWLARRYGLQFFGIWVVMGLHFILLLPSYTAFSAMYIFISCAAPTKELLGTTNGIGQTVFSAMGIVGPAGITSLFALSNQYDLLNGQLVYVVTCGLCGLGALSSHFLLPDKPGEEASKEYHRLDVGEYVEC